MRKQGCVHPVPSSPVLRPVPFYFRAVHSAQDLLTNRAGKWLLISWPLPHPPPPTAGLPVPHNCITAGNFKLVASVHTAISICFSAVSSTNRASQPVPARQAIPRWGPTVVAERAGIDGVTQGNGAENAGAGTLASIFTFVSDMTDCLAIATSWGRHQQGFTRAGLVSSKQHG